MTDNQFRYWNIDYTVQLYLSELYLEPANLQSFLQIFRHRLLKGPRTKMQTRALQGSVEDEITQREACFALELLQRTLRGTNALVRLSSVGLELQEIRQL